MSFVCGQTMAETTKSGDFVNFWTVLYQLCQNLASGSDSDLSKPLEERPG